MTRIGGSSPGLIPPTLAHGAPVSALLSDLPPALRNVALGTFLSGTVLERTAGGLTMLQTGAGVLGLRTTVPLPTGSTVMLQVQTAGAQLQAIVLSVTPQNAAPARVPPAVSAGHGPAPAASPAPAPAQAGAAPPAVLSAPVDGRAAAPATITATVIGPPGGAPPPSQPGAATPAPPQSAAPQSPPAPLPSSSGAPASAPTTPAAVVPAAQAAVYQRQMAAFPVPAAPSAPSAGPAAPFPAAGTGTTPVPQPGASAPPPQPSSPQPLPNGTQLQVRLVPAGETTTPNAPAATPAQPYPAPAATIAGQRAAGAPPATLPTSNPAMPQTAQPTLPAGGAMPATIVARTPAGHTIVDTPVGRILARMPRGADNIADGGRIFLELVATGKPAAAGPTLTPGPSLLAREWPGLKEVARLLQHAPAPEAQALLDHALPKPGPQLAQQVLAFLGAAAQGGARGWLGETIIRALERLGADHLVGRLDHDLREMLTAQRGTEADWRLTIVPLLDGRELRQVRFFERRRKRNEPDRNREEPGRFVVECEHSEIGPMQLDGLVHEKRLDMILRTHEKLPAEMERDLLVLFGSACAGLDLGGQLFFQTVAKFPVSPLDEFSGGAVQVSV